MVSRCDKQLAQTADSSSNRDDTTVDSTNDPQSQMTGYLTQEQIMEQFGDVITRPELLDEGYNVQEMLRSMPTRIEVDTEWYFIPKKWLNKWETHCYVDIINVPLDDASVNVRNVDRKSPGKIPFTSLFEEMQDDQIQEQMLRAQWQNYQIRAGMREGVDFILVTRDVFQALVEKYGSDERKPENLFKRIGVEQDDGEVVCELKMRKIQFLAVPNKTRFKMREPWFFYAPKSMSVLELEKKALRHLNYYMYTIRKDKTTMYQKCRLWVTSAEKEWEDFVEVDKKFMNYTHAAIDAVPVSLTDAQKKMKVDDVNFVDDDVFVIETQKNDKFVFSQQGGDEEESKTGIAAQMAEMAEQAAGNFNMEEFMSTDLERLVKPGGSCGLTGLQNLGNTCFMNSGLQCMSNTPELTKYFLMGYHLKEKNETNPLGMKGRLARAFGDLIREMWCGHSGRTAPHDLKRTLGQRISRFSGYGQQDSAELVNYLLDLIHEDLNRVRQKPYVEMSDNNDRPDAEIAKEFWDGFKARNSSIITDLMYGQLKSTVTCLTCRRVANAFDPYLSV